jgi:hypothetical protein
MTKKKEQLIATLLKVLGAEETLNKQFDLIISVLSRKYPSVTKEIMDKISEESGVKPLLNRMIEKYDITFSEEDVQKIIDFFASEVGNKMRNKSHLEAIEKTQIEWSLLLEKRFFEADQKR